jgi:hypothetical protein
MGLKCAFPGTELFLRQLVATAGFLESNLAAKHRCDHGGLAAHHPPLGRRGWQGFNGRRSDRQLAGRRIYWAMRGSRGSRLALATSMGTRPVKTDSLIPAIIAPFHQLNPCAKRNSRLSHEFLTILSGLSPFFSKISKKPDRGTGAARPGHEGRINRSNSASGRWACHSGVLTLFQQACNGRILSTSCNRHAENRPPRPSNIDFTY